MNKFTKAIKEKLKNSVSGLCSNPECRCSTTIYNHDTDEGITGEAAHIYDKVQEGNSVKRKKPADCNIQLNSFENGIWLCQKCHNIIDNLPSNYTVSTLLRWKKSAENYANDKYNSGSSDKPSLDTRHFRYDYFNNFQFFLIYKLLETKSDICFKLNGHCIDYSVTEMLNEIKSGKYNVNTFECDKLDDLFNSVHFDDTFSTFIKLGIGSSEYYKASFDDEHTFEDVLGNLNSFPYIIYRLSYQDLKQFLKNTKTSITDLRKELVHKFIH